MKPRGGLAALHEMPFDRLVAAAQFAAKKAYPSVDYSTPIDFGRHGETNAWAPTVDGRILPEHPFWTTAPAASAGVPLIVGRPSPSSASASWIPTSRSSRSTSSADAS